jgi:putative NIF3 family GTP cyclohydrolase 1 type 2
MKSISIFLTALLLLTVSFSAAGQAAPPVTAGSMIENIIKHTGANPITNTVDVIKTGNPQTVVTGIVTCMFAPMNVLKKAVEMNCNLIIVHEPVFYNHRDETQQFATDPVFLEKKKYIDDHKLVIWRFHDYVHSLKPDGIDYGMIRKIGWLNYAAEYELNNITLPETTLNGVLQHLKKVFPKSTFNVVGDPNMKVSKVMFSAGAPGSPAHFTMLRKQDTDLIIAGEVPQWETYEYVRDAVNQGKKKAIIFLGHIPSEEGGMEYAAEWLKGFIKDVPVSFVECGPSYWTY